jgi:hypothetical protein
MNDLITLENLGTVNKNRVSLNGIGTFWFSYSTCVAFSTPKTGFVCSQNIWSKTTGKLLNEICPDKTHRIDNETFNKLLAEITL